MDRSAFVDDVSERLTVIQRAVSPEIWHMILLLEEQLIAYHHECMESSYHRGYLQGLLEGKGIKTEQPRIHDE
ncbi:MAG: hypothetical protein JWN30_1287 [Bacilli bacterium]|nr:hypothetical protein [Bacilli bacterium]